MDEEYWMNQALQLAKLGVQKGEVPIGALLVSKEGQILGQGHNQPISTHDPTAHAEIVAIRQAGASIQNYRLLDSTLFVTLEPCLMCAGAILNARIAHLVFGAFDPKRGELDRSPSILRTPYKNHLLSWRGGVLKEESQKILQDFFQKKRAYYQVESKN